MGQLMTIALGEHQTILRRFAATEGQVKRASSRSIKKVTGWAGSQVARGIAAEDAVPLRALTSGAGRTGRMHKRVWVRKPKGNGTSGSVWLGHNPVKAAYLGRLSQQKLGAKAGRHFFLGGFIATMRSGHRSVFMRDTRARLPITEETLELESAQRVVDRVSGQVPQRLTTMLRQELNYEVNVRGAG